MEILRQNVGIDIGKDTFRSHADSFIARSGDQASQNKNISKHPERDKEFYQWVKKNKPVHAK